MIEKLPDNIEKFKRDFFDDLEARREQHKKMNFHYLMYKGILYFNTIYGEEYVKTLGLQANVPRTFMTIESIRPHLSGRPLDIDAKNYTLAEKENAKKAVKLLKTEWHRSRADWQKADAEFYALLLGTGYLMSRFVDDHEQLPMYDGANVGGDIKWKKGKFQRYKGMRARSLNPWNVIPDRDARTEEESGAETWEHCYIYSLWDTETFKRMANTKRYNNLDKVEKGGHLEEFDSVRRKIDAIYQYGTTDLKTRDSGKLISVNKEVPSLDFANKIMVVERFTNDDYTVCAGANWTEVLTMENPDPDKIIPIKPVRDYRVPDEFDGIGEAEAIRWQQYEENKVHNLTYYQTLMNTVSRYGVVEEMLTDPTSAGMDNPFKPIKIKGGALADVNKAIQVLQQKSPNDVPFKFLEVIDRIRQETTGVSSYMTSSPDSGVGTLGEANIMKMAGLDRIRQKIYQIEERDLTEVLKHWLACIPQYYTEEMDLLIGDKEDDFVKYLPYDRQWNEDISTVAKESIKLGIQGASLEEIYKKAGYVDVVFVSDIIGGYDIEIKTAMSVGDRETLIGQFNMVLKTMMDVNKVLGREAWDIEKLSGDLLKEFPDIVKDVESYKKQEEQAPEPQPAPPMAEALNLPPEQPAQPQMGEIINEMPLEGEAPIGTPAV